MSNTPARNTEIVHYQERVKSVRSLLERLKGQLSLALPRHLTPDRMLRVVLTACQRTPQLLDCDQRSLAAAVVQAAQLGLEPDGIMGHAYLVPFKNQVQLIPGYRGLLHLARQSGEISSISVDTVHEGDAWRFSRGLVEVLEHVPSEEPEVLDEDGRPIPRPMLRAYAVARFKDGGHQIEVMSKAQIDAIRARSRAGNNGPWVTDYLMMARKTVLKRLCKYLPASIERDRAIDLDERAEAGLDQGLDDMVDVTPEPAPAEPAPTVPTIDSIKEQARKAKGCTGCQPPKQITAGCPVHDPATPPEGE